MIRALLALLLFWRPDPDDAAAGVAVGSRR